MGRRNRRSGVEDRWAKTVRDAGGTTRSVPSAAYSSGLRWRARYVGPDGKEYSKRFGRKVDAQQWLDRETPARSGGDGQGNHQGFPAITPHGLRHTCASLAIRDAGANVKVVQTLLGHESATMTLDLYGHLYPDDLNAVADRLDVGAREAATSLRPRPTVDDPSALRIVR